MTRLLVLCCFSLLLAGVFGADVTAIKGNSVTLLINSEEIKEADDLLWMFEQNNIATIDLEAENSIAEYPDKRFSGRLNVDRNTGSLTISNIRTEDKGVYKLEITSSGEPKYRTFRVTVNETKPLSGKVGKSITLNIDNETQAEDVIEVKFENTLIAKVENNKLFYTSAGNRFSGRLKLNDKPRSLLITHITAEDSGLYDVNINNIKHIIHRRYSVTVTDSSSSSHQEKTGPGIFVVVIMLVIALI